MYKVTDIQVENGVLHFKGFDKPQTRGAGFGTAVVAAGSPTAFRIKLDPSNVQPRPGYYAVRVQSGTLTSRCIDIEESHALYQHLEKGMGH